MKLKHFVGLTLVVLYGIAAFVLFTYHDKNVVAGISLLAGCLVFAGFMFLLLRSARTNHSSPPR